MYNRIAIESTLLMYVYLLCTLAIVFILNQTSMHNVCEYGEGFVSIVLTMRLECI